MDRLPPAQPRRADVQPLISRSAGAPKNTLGRRAIVLLLVVALHATGGLALTYLGTRTATPPEIRPIEVSFIPQAAPPQPEVQPPAPPPPIPIPVQKPAPPKPQPVKRPPPPKAAPPKPAEPVLTQSATALSSAEPEPAPAPAPMAPAQPIAADTGPAAPAPAAVSAARFDADYLNNPAPAYPPLSRRMREEGKVMLRVVVKPDGLPGRIETARSSGSERLDEAARNAVSRWRFVPARQGERAIEASVLVPIIFKLEGN
ncbi:MAG: energy transducer TonB [Azoarcus sp.]|nr:energy transducer TonB [Azoarcus sp.]